ncbi:MAG: hypothetical protein Q4E09_03430 [Eubacteriales bacterium]|nr:hypothetical protein [Eubacteriales bacterium]
MKKSTYQAELRHQAPTSTEKQKMWDRLEAAFDQEIALSADHEFLDKRSMEPKPHGKVIAWRPILSLVAVLAIATCLYFLLPPMQTNRKDEVSLKRSLPKSEDSAEQEDMPAPVAVARFYSATEAENDSVENFQADAYKSNAEIPITVSPGIWTLITDQEQLVLVLSEDSEQKVDLYYSADQDSALSGNYNWEAGYLVMTFDQEELTFLSYEGGFALAGRSEHFSELEIDSHLSYFGSDTQENRAKVWQSKTKQN